jgi:hypothetical protein
MHWSDLYSANVLYLSKSVKIKTQKESNIQTFVEHAEDAIKITPTGNYTVKKETFFKPGERLSTMSFKFTAEKTGNINPLLLKGSSIKIRGNHEERVSFK